MSAWPVAVDADQTIATNPPSSAIDTLAFARPVTAIAAGPTARGTAIPQNSTNTTNTKRTIRVIRDLRPFRSLPTAPAALRVDASARAGSPTPSEFQSRRELKCPGIANRGDLSEGCRWAQGIGSGTEIPIHGHNVHVIRQIEG